MKRVIASVAWTETRNDQLFFVSADWLGSTWIFSERSAFQDAWYPVPATIQRIDAAEVLTGRTLALAQYAA